jgi:sirohydrochlorin ferrochelatase
MINISKIDISKLASELRRLENQWVAISEDNRIVAKGSTYREAVERVSDPDKVVLLKVPSVKYSLAPAA